METPNIIFLLLTLALSSGNLLANEQSTAMITGKAMLSAALVGGAFVMDGIAAGLSLKSHGDIQQDTQITTSSKGQSKSGLRASQGLFWTSMGLTAIAGGSALFLKDAVALPVASSSIAAILGTVGAGMVGADYGNPGTASQQDKDKIRDSTTPALGAGVAAVALDWASLAFITWYVTYGRPTASTMHSPPQG